MVGNLYLAQSDFFSIYFHKKNITLYIFVPSDDYIKFIEMYYPHFMYIAFYWFRKIHSIQKLVC